MSDRSAKLPSHSSRDPRSGDRIGHYELVSEIDRGGMGVVYRARDLRLGRIVALKRPALDRSSDPGLRKRFLREARLASRLSHAHIVPIFEVIEHEGVPWLAMLLVEGQSLRQVIAQRGPLPVREVLRHAETLSEALDAAHRGGVLHRDINPNNVMVGPDGRVLLADFGLASAFVAPGDEASASTRSTPLTAEGQAVGTPGYISPEQALGHNVDARSDIFSLGAVLYEMCTGRGPFKSTSATETLDRLLHREPVPISRLNYEVPEELERIVRKSLAKNPDERYQDARDLLADLHALRQRFEHETYIREHPAPVPDERFTLGRRALVACAILLVVVASAVVARWIAPARTPKRSHTLAISDFRNLSADPKLEYFSRGLTGEMVARLAGLGGVFVVRAGVGAGSDLLLDTGVERQGDAVRLEYRLTEGKHRNRLTEGEERGTLEELFSLEDRVAESIAERLSREWRQPIRYVGGRPPTVDMAAYDLYLRAKSLMERPQDPQRVDQAIEDLQEAQKRDPRFGRAFALAGQAAFRKYELSRESTWLEKGRAACHRAVDLDPMLATAHVCLGTIHNGLGQYADAAAEFLKAIELDATSEEAYTGLGLAHQGLGKPDEAEKAFQKAVTLYPGYWMAHAALGSFYYRRARYAEAAQQFEQVVELAPDNPIPYSSLGGIYISLGRYEEAIRVLDKAIAIRPTFDAITNRGTAYLNLRNFDEAVKAFERAIEFEDADYASYGRLAHAYYWAPGRRDEAVQAFLKAVRMGQDRLRVNPQDADAHLMLAFDYAMLDRGQEARSHLEDALALRPGDPECLFFAGLVYNRLGQRDRALEWLERAVAGGYSTAEIRSAIELDNLRNDPRFAVLLSKK